MARAADQLPETVFPQFDYLTFNNVDDLIEKIDNYVEFYGSVELQCLDQNNIDHLVMVVWKPHDKKLSEKQFRGTLKRFNRCSTPDISLSALKKALQLPSPFDDIWLNWTR